jgi:hypothetical protein
MMAKVIGWIAEILIGSSAHTAALVKSKTVFVDADWSDE